MDKYNLLLLVVSLPFVFSFVFFCAFNFSFVIFHSEAKKVGQRSKLFENFSFQLEVSFIEAVYTLTHAYFLLQCTTYFLLVNSKAGPPFSESYSVVWIEEGLH